MQERIRRIDHLLSTNRISEARAEVTQLMGEHPNAPYPHALMARCQLAAGEMEEARAMASRAIVLDPETAYYQYLLGQICLRMEKLDEAGLAAEEALRLDPANADNYFLKALVLMRREKWTEGLAQVDEALRVDPDHQSSLNLRGTILTQMRRYSEAGESMAGALQRDPNDAYAHSNQGWHCLHRGDQQGAETHFREALRLQPDLERARVGILEALKSKNVVYRHILSGLLYLGTLPQNIQLIIMVGGFLLYRFLLSASNANPSLAPWIAPVLTLYLVLVFITWAWRPVSNAVLLFHPFGRLALSRREKIGAGICAVFLIIAASWYAASLYTGFSFFALLAMAWCFATIPAAVASEARSRTKTLIAAGWAGLMLALVHAIFVIPTMAAALVGAFIISLLVWFWGLGHVVNR